MSLPDHRPGFLNTTKYIEFPRNEATWLVKDLIPVSGKALIYAQSKVGKSSIALQLANTIACGGEWMTFPIMKTGRVLYLQLDNPGTTWCRRVITFRENGLALPDEKIFFADAATVPTYPFDILQPTHANWLKAVVQPLNPVMVIVDTLRKTHSGDENSSTIMSNVMNSLYGAVFPSALLVISHDKKPSADMDKDIITDHRGSSSVVGEMDAILRLTKTRMYYAGRNVEADAVRLIKHVIEHDEDSTIIWEPDPKENIHAVAAVLADTNLTSWGAKGKVLAATLNISEAAAVSRLRRFPASKMLKAVPPQPTMAGEVEPYESASLIPVLQ